MSLRGIIDTQCHSCQVLFVTWCQICQFVIISDVKTINERKRHAVRAGISEVAQELFVSQGYEATTVDQISAAAGMSRRTFFRYFASKEDLLTGRFELVADDLVVALRERPANEPAWDSLRRSFDPLIDYYRDPHRRERDAVTWLLIETNPDLFASYLVKLDMMKERLVGVLVERAVMNNGHGPIDSYLIRALVGAAVECLLAAFHAVGPEYDIEVVAARLDDLMRKMRSAVAGEVSFSEAF